MTTPLDDLFSPERLRKNWQRSTVPLADPTPAETAPAMPMALIHQLRDLIHDQFSAQDAAALNMMIDELEALMTRIFPDAATDGDTHPQPDAVPAAHEALNRIEDLVEAFELAGPPRR